MSKFGNCGNVGELLYHLSLDQSWFGEMESAQEYGGSCYNKRDGAISAEDIESARVEFEIGELSPDEIAELTGMVGCIVRESQQGFISYETFTDPAALAKSWAECVDDCRGEDEPAEDDQIAHDPDRGDAADAGSDK